MVLCSHQRNLTASFLFIENITMETRNIAIIAHVDHGKTTLTDAILQHANSSSQHVSMDNNALEQERGITIYAKNAAFEYKGAKINIVDTPGHADFGGEVERILRSIDCVLLIVDAQEGPMPQTRFVLKKSLELGLRPIVVLNKIDKPAADADRALNQVFDLFVELNATDEQLDFPIIYAIGKDGVAMKNIDDEKKDLIPLLDMIVDHVSPAENDTESPLQAQPFNLGYDNFLGRLAIVRVYKGILKNGSNVIVKKPDGTNKTYKITKLFSYSDTSRVETDTIEAGDIGMVAGLTEIFIGDTICESVDTPLLDSISVDEPTIELTFLVNNSPFAGREGKFVTSRQIRDRLEKELEMNVGLKVEFGTESADKFIVKGRGELHVAILIENMRREGYELQVSQPSVIVKDIDGVKSEPFEEIVVDIPAEFQGQVIEKLSNRAATMTHMEPHESRVLMNFEGPSRGLFGYRNAFVVDTKGEGIIATRVLEYRPYAGEIARKETGAMISQVTGKTLSFALENLQSRGQLYITPNTEVYEGMVIGNTSKGEQMLTNPTKGKQLTNMRASGNDETTKLIPPQLITIETGLEIMGKDEYLEVTPQNVRLRKQNLTETDRSRAKRN